MAVVVVTSILVDRLSNGNSWVEAATRDGGSEVASGSQGNANVHAALESVWAVVEVLYAHNEENKKECGHELLEEDRPANTIWEAMSLGFFVNHIDGWWAKFEIWIELLFISTIDNGWVHNKDGEESSKNLGYHDHNSEDEGLSSSGSVLWVKEFFDENSGGDGWVHVSTGDSSPSVDDAEKHHWDSCVISTGLTIWVVRTNKVNGHDKA